MDQADTPEVGARYLTTRRIPRCELAARGSLMVIHAGQRAMTAGSNRLWSVPLLYVAAVLSAQEGFGRHGWHRLLPLSVRRWRELAGSRSTGGPGTRWYRPRRRTHAAR
jgi:hypothetical protein